MTRLTVVAPSGVPEVHEGDDLTALLLAAATPLADGDVVVVTSKVVSKAEGRLRPEAERAAAIEEETVRVVARRGPTTVVRNRLGLTMAAAGVDSSNLPAGWIALLPLDPDATARRLRTEILERTGCNVGVVVTDTSGRAWREGQTDIAIGVAGIMPLETYSGRVDEHGNPLAVTAPAVADEIAGAAELAQRKLGGRPFAVVRGRPDLVTSAGVDGPGAQALIRGEAADMFGYGAREAVVQALTDPVTGFGDPADVADLAHALSVVAAAHGWAVRVEADTVTVHRPDDPGRGRSPAP